MAKKKTLVERALDTLRKALRWNRVHGRKSKAARIARDIDVVQDDLTPPKRIKYPGVAAARAQSREGGLPGDPHAETPGAGWCLMMVRLCYGIPAKYRRAIDAWHGAKRKHVTADPMKIPRGVPVFFAPNHIAISAGDGACWSTDVKRDGVFDKIGIRALEEKWGLTLLGWSADLNGEDVPVKVVLP
jgi:hypothetical protein